MPCKTHDDYMNALSKGGTNHDDEGPNKPKDRIIIMMMMIKRNQRKEKRIRRR